MNPEVPGVGVEDDVEVRSMDMEEEAADVLTTVWLLVVV
jgi:hypothetical protein